MGTVSHVNETVARNEKQQETNRCGDFFLLYISATDVAGTFSSALRSASETPPLSTVCGSLLNFPWLSCHIEFAITVHFLPLCLLDTE